MGWRSRATARKNTASASSLTVMARSARIWLPAEVAAAVVFQTDRRRAAPYRPPPHVCLPGTPRGAQWSSGAGAKAPAPCERRRCTSVPATASGAWGRREVGAVGSIAYAAAGRMMRLPASSSWCESVRSMATGPYRNVKRRQRLVPIIKKIRWPAMLAVSTRL